MILRVGDDCYINTDQIVMIGKIYSNDGGYEFDISFSNGEKLTLFEQTIGEATVRKFKLIEKCGGDPNDRL